MRIFTKIENQLRITALYTAFSAENMPDHSSTLFRINSPEFAREILDDMQKSFDINDISILDIKEGREILAHMAVKKLELLLLGMLSENTKNKQKRNRKEQKILKRLFIFLKKTFRNVLPSRR